MSHELAHAFAIALALALTQPADALAQAEASAGVESHTTAAAQTDSTPVKLAAGASLQAVLETKLDARRAKVDDAVTARTTQAVEAQADTALTLPRGSKLLGRVTQVDVAADGTARSDSRLGVVFDRVVLSDGRELAAELELQALAAAEMESDRLVTSPSARAAASARSRGGLVGSAAGTLGAATEVVTGAAGSVGAQADTALRGVGQLDAGLSSSTRGVVGLQGLSLEASGSRSTIVSTRGPVVLRSGTRLLLRARASAN